MKGSSCEELMNFQRLPYPASLYHCQRIRYPIVTLLDFCQFIVYSTKGSYDQLFCSYQVVLLFAAWFDLGFIHSGTTVFLFAIAASQLVALVRKHMNTSLTWKLWRETCNEHGSP